MCRGIQEHMNLSVAYLILVYSVIPSEILKTGMLFSVGKMMLSLNSRYASAILGAKYG